MDTDRDYDIEWNYNQTMYALNRDNKPEVVDGTDERKANFVVLPGSEGTWGRKVLFVGDSTIDQ